MLEDILYTRNTVEGLFSLLKTKTDLPLLLVLYEMYRDRKKLKLLLWNVQNFPIFSDSLCCGSSIRLSESSMKAPLVILSAPSGSFLDCKK